MPLAAAIIPAVIGAGASIGTGLIGAHAANTAANQQVQAAQQGINLTQQNAQQAIGYQNAALQNITNAYSPYYTAGTQGLTSLSQALAPGGSLAQNWNQQFQAPTAAQAAATPGYQFALEQGLNAVQSSAAAQGNLLSGGTMKALNNYAQGMASTNYQQTYNNAFNQYLQNYNQFQTSQANQYARLMGLTGIGQSATGALGTAQLGVAGNIGNVLTGASGAISNLLGAQGQARATGTMGAANAYGGMVGGLGSAAASLPWGNWFGGSGTITNPGLMSPGGSYGSAVSPSLGSVGALPSLTNLPAGILG